MNFIIPTSDIAHSFMKSISPMVKVSVEWSNVGPIMVRQLASQTSEETAHPQSHPEFAAAMLETSNCDEVVFELPEDRGIFIQAYHNAFCSLTDRLHRSGLLTPESRQRISHATPWRDDLIIHQE